LVVSLLLVGELVDKGGCVGHARKPALVIVVNGALSLSGFGSECLGDEAQDLVERVVHEPLGHLIVVVVHADSFGQNLADL
jgi:hypothetical protein